MIPIGDTKTTSFKKPTYQNSQSIPPAAPVGLPTPPSHLNLTRRKINILGKNALQYNLRGTSINAYFFYMLRAILQALVA